MSPTDLLVFLLIAGGGAAAAAVATAAPPTAYDLLKQYNFPIGLLPQGVTGYDLDPATGKFSAYIGGGGTCSFSLEGSYKLRYRSTISGVISPNHLKDLQGISVKVLFFWLNIVEVTRRDNELEFSVGVLSSSFPLENFNEQPKCGCGLDCVDLLRLDGGGSARDQPEELGSMSLIGNLR